MEEIKRTIGQVLRDIASRYPNKQAIKYTTLPYERTWKEFDEETDNIAKGLLALGLNKGDHLAIWATNVPQWLSVLFATAKAGIILVTVNTNYKIFEMEYLLRQSDSKALVMIDGSRDNSYVNIINNLCPEIANSKDCVINSDRFPYLKRIIHIGGNTPKGMIDYNDLIELGVSISDEEYTKVTNSLDCYDIINMQYTSGTTGFPKGVMLSHYNILNNGKAIGDCMNFTVQDKLCITVPLFHCFGLVLGVMTCITHDSSMVVIPEFNAGIVLSACETEKCTALHGVPTMFISELAHPDFKKFNLCLRTGIMAGSPCPITVMNQVVEEMGVSEITIVYGQTEASPGCTQTHCDDSIDLRVETVGRAFPGVEIKIIDTETGEKLGIGQAGEFCARGYNIMKGYYNMPEATALAIDEDKWLHTGDLATVDKDGYYKIVGRIKDMIIRGGENLYPKEIEEFLYNHPKIYDVQVIGLPSKKYGEEVCACIIVKPNETLTVEEVKEYVRANMARHKTPSYVRFMESFPTTASGKIQKFILREEGIEIYGLQDAASIETA